MPPNISKLVQAAPGLFTQGQKASQSLQSGDRAGGVQTGADVIVGGLNATGLTKGTGAGAGVATTVGGAASGAASGIGTAIAVAAALGTAAGPVGTAAGAAIGAVVGLVLALVGWKSTADAERAQEAWERSHTTTVDQARQIVTFMRLPDNAWMLDEPRGPELLEKFTALAQIPRVVDWREYLTDPGIYRMVAEELRRQGKDIADPAVRERLGLPSLNNPFASLHKASSARVVASNASAVKALTNPFATLRHTSAADVARQASSGFAAGRRDPMSMLAAPGPAPGQNTSAGLPKMALAAAVLGGIWYFLNGR